jgi:hypothetical protein
VGLVPAVTTIAVVAAGSVALAVAIGRRRAGVASLGA